jgi:hypothetical protein
VGLTVGKLIVRIAVMAERHAVRCIMLLRRCCNEFFCRELERFGGGKCV